MTSEESDETYIMHGNLSHLTNKQTKKQRANSDRLKLTVLSVGKSGNEKIERRDMTLPAQAHLERVWYR